MMVDFASLLDGPVFDLFGVPATYRPKVGEAFAIKVLVVAGSRLHPPSRLPHDFTKGLQVDTMAVDVKQSEVIDPQEGDRVELDGKSYLVQPGREQDSVKLTWRLSLL